MAKVDGWGTALGIGFKWIDKAINYFKKKGRRDAIQKMENAVDSDNNDAINKRLSDLYKRAKNKDDSR